MTGIMIFLKSILVLLSLEISMARGLVCQDPGYYVSSNEHAVQRKFHLFDEVNNQYLLVEPQTMLLSMVSSEEFEIARR